MRIHLPSFRRRPESRATAPLDPGLRRGDDTIRNEMRSTPARMFETGVGALFVAFWYRACQGHAVTRSYDKP